jgi:hypothetical protein
MSATTPPVSPATLRDSVLLGLGAGIVAAPLRRLNPTLSRAGVVGGPATLIGIRVAGRSPSLRRIAGLTPAMGLRAPPRRA